MHVLIHSIGIEIKKLIIFLGNCRPYNTLPTLMLLSAHLHIFPVLVSINNKTQLKRIDLSSQFFIIIVLLKKYNLYQTSMHCINSNYFVHSTYSDDIFIGPARQSSSWNKCNVSRKSMERILIVDFKKIHKKNVWCTYVLCY